MKLEVGMYVRTKNGEIGKIRVIIDNMVFINTNQYYSTVVKASHNLLGNDEEPSIIGRGDYVNGEEVYGLYEYNGKRYVDVDRVCYSEEDIKSILTKEQFESMSYKVGE